MYLLPFCSLFSGCFVVSLGSFLLFLFILVVWWLSLVLYFTNKLDSLEEMDKFLETYNLLRLNHEQIENMKRLITSKEIKSVKTNKQKNKKTSQQKKAQD